MRRTIDYDFSDSHFGPLLIASSGDGICFLDFVTEDPESSLQRLAAALPGLPLHRRAGAMARVAGTVFDPAAAKHLQVDLRGTDFQIAVWRALRKIPHGQTATYAAVAGMLGRPNAVRAVAGAIARNRIAGLVPCHRVIRSDGGLGGFRWGTGLKARLLAFEQSSDRSRDAGGANWPIYRAPVPAQRPAIR